MNVVTAYETFLENTSSFELTTFVTLIYFIAYLVVGLRLGRKFLFKPSKKANAIERIQDNAFQLVGFVLVAISVLMTHEKAATDFAEPLSIFSFAFLLLVMSILLAEIKTINLIPYVTERLNYLSLLCLSIGFMVYFTKRGVFNANTFVVYAGTYVFILLFIVTDLRNNIKFFRKFGNAKRRRKKLGNLS